MRFESVTNFLNKFFQSWVAKLYETQFLELNLYILV